MTESWVIDESSSALSSEAVLETLRARISVGALDTWLISSSGRRLAFVTNTERAMVVLMDGEGDPGEHCRRPRI
jgi:hypothetical protein